MKFRMFLACVLFLTACNHKNGNGNNQSSAQIDNSSATNIDSVKGTDIKVISDIETWKHPVKDVLLNEKVKLNKVELSKKQTYPTFYVTFRLLEQDPKLNTKHIFNLAESVAKANAFWDYRMVDGQNGIDLKVYCDKSGKILKSIDFNGDIKQFSSFVEISRKDAGLDLIPIMDFDKFSLNQRIQELLSGDTYKDEDYKNGIAHVNETYIITERFTENVIDTIDVQTKPATIKSLLGDPSIISGSSYFYKTKNYYIGFDNDGYIMVSKKEHYPKIRRDIFIEIFKRLEIDEYEVFDDSSFYGFTYRNIHGGGSRVESDIGVEILNFIDDKAITVYNNIFEGKLYKNVNPDFPFKIIFQNEDKITIKINSALNSFKDDNKDFENEGRLSPDGKYKSIYRWVYSMEQYFLIRTVDFSKADFYISVPSADYRWISDTEIEYVDFFDETKKVIDIEEEYEKK